MLPGGLEGFDLGGLGLRVSSSKVQSFEVVRGYLFYKGYARVCTRFHDLIALRGFKGLVRAVERL